MREVRVLSNTCSIWFGWLVHIMGLLSGLQMGKYAVFTLGADVAQRAYRDEHNHGELRDMQGQEIRFGCKHFKTVLRHPVLNSTPSIGRCSDCHQQSTSLIMKKKLQVSLESRSSA